EIAVAEPVRAEDRHRRFRVVFHRLHFILFISLNPFARIHNLYREEIFIFLNALDRRSGGWRQRHGLESLSETFSASAKPQSNSLARARNSDARQVGSQPSADALHPMTTGAVRAKDSFSIHSISARRISRGGSGQRPQVCENLPRLGVLDAWVGGHLGPRH